MRKQHPRCHQDQQIWTKSCARAPARISLSTVKVWMLGTMRSCQSLLTTVTVPVRVLTMRSCQPPWGSHMPSMTMEEMEVTTMRRSFLRSPARASATRVSTDGRARVLGSSSLSTHLTKCMGQTTEGICILKPTVVRVAAHDDGGLVISHSLAQLHGMLGQAATIRGGAGPRQDQRAATGPEAAGPGLMLLVHCFLASDCQCCTEAWGCPLNSACCSNCWCS